MSKFIYGVSILSGTIIGIGLFALPFVALKSGIMVLLFYFLLIGPIAILVHYFFAELAIHTPDFKRLPGFVRIYLGKRAEIFSRVIIILALIGTNLAYLILGGEFLNELFNPFIGGNSFIYTSIYFILGAAIIFFGIKAIAKIQFFGLLLFFLVLFFIFFKGFPFWSFDNLFLKTGGLKDFFLPYGVVLFSLWGVVVVPEIEETLGDQKEILRKIIPISIILPIFVSILFTFSVLGITGLETTESALTGLRNVLGDGVVSLTLFFGVLTTFTSFIVLGLTLKKVLWYDMKIPKKTAWAIACFSPFLLFLIGFKDFIAVVSFVGAVMWATEGILINLMYKKLPFERLKYPRLRHLAYPLIIIFLLGIIYEIYYFFR